MLGAELKKSTKLGELIPVIWDRDMGLIGTVVGPAADEVEPDEVAGGGEGEEGYELADEERVVEERAAEEEGVGLLAF